MTEKERLEKIRQIVIDSINDIDDINLLELITDFIDEHQFVPEDDEED